MEGGEGGSARRWGEEEEGCKGGARGVGGEREVGGDGREEGGGDDDDDEGVYYAQQPVGLVVEVRVSAPVICVFLVHDRSGGNGSSKRPASAASAAGGVAPETNANSSVELLARDAAASVGDGGGRDRGGSPPVPTGDITDEQLGRGASGNPTADEGDLGEGALVLLEVCGLGVEYRDTGGGDSGGGDIHRIELGTPAVGNATATAAAARAVYRTRGGGGGEDGGVSGDDGRGGGGGVGGGRQRPATTSSRFSLTAASFRVKDMFQKGGDAFSYLLSSTAPPPFSPPGRTGKRSDGGGGGCLPEENVVSGAPAAAAAPTEDALRVTRAFSEKGGAGDDRGPTSRTTITLGGMWANWNPETVAALSIFAYGMYGNGGISGRGTGSESHDSADPGGEGIGCVGEERGIGGGEDGGGRGGEEAEESCAKEGPGSSSASVGGSSGEGGGVAPPKKAGDGCAAEDEPAREGGVVVVEVKRLSLWLNKEVHGRRLLLLEAGTSSVRLRASCPPFVLYGSGVRSFPRFLPYRAVMCGARV